MISAKCTVTLLSDKNRKVDIQLRKEDDGKFFWKVIEPTVGSLRVPASNGTWFIADFSDILTLFHTVGGSAAQGNLTLVAYKVKPDFLKAILSGESIVTEDAELYNGNISEQKVSCTLQRMY
ncbi:MAG: hypothetical protein LH472_02465 [Pyrinomonadaceae bacterium]|nr:hypothetical protein [Pyrinomonadaceae bacterium]